MASQTTSTCRTCTATTTSPRARKTASRAMGVKNKALPRQETELFLGSSKSCHDSMLCSALLEHVAKGLEGDSATLKQSRKAREERELARK